jgi:peptidoglycan/xylan/chitin deacetylase (PgdA/CDA1 family)
MILRGKKKFLADIMFGKLSFLFEPLFSKVKKNHLTVLAYHRIYPNLRERFLFDKEIISAIPEILEQQVRKIKAYFEVINFYQLRELLSAKKSVPQNTLIITFDDGYADNYEIACKILSTHGITGVFFVTTAYIDKMDPFWFEKLFYLVNQMKERTMVLGDEKLKVVVNKKNKNAAIKKILDFISKVDENQRIQVLTDIEEQSGVLLKDIEHVRTLSREQIGTMCRHGFEIGSHTVSHPFLSRVNNITLDYELRESKKHIEEITGQEVISVGYPFGDFNQNVINKAYECGYLFGCSYQHGIIEYRPEVALKIPRIHIEENVTLSLFKSYLLFPKMFLRNET